jgi:hypothetical protein
VLGAARTELAIGLAMTSSAAALLVLAGPTLAADEPRPAQVKAA